MPYTWSSGKPDIQQVIITGDPRWATRTPRNKGGVEDHVSVVFSEEDAQIVVVEESDDHNSINTYYKVQEEIPTKTIVLPATDERIRWEYDKSSRQSARPYVSGVGPQTTLYIKKCVDRDSGKLRSMFAVPKELVPTDESYRPPPGDVIALMNRRMMAGDKSGVHSLQERLSTGGRICVYLK